MGATSSSEEFESAEMHHGIIYQCWSMHAGSMCRIVHDCKTMPDVVETYALHWMRS